MNKIVLLGDSIRMGYEAYVKDALAQSAEVYYPNENCRFAEYVLRYAHEWKDAGKWGDDVDLVHWNAGLWDVLELFGDGPLTSLSYYGEAIARIDRRLRLLFPRARMVFATSTNVRELAEGSKFARHNANIETYNAEALRVLANTDTVINDLYTLTASLPDDYRSDWVHFYTSMGTRAIGGQVLSVICDQLGLSARSDAEASQTVAYSKQSIGY